MMRFDIQTYHRQLRLAVYYKNKPDTTMLPFMPKSTWSPALAQLPPEVSDLIQLDLNSFKKEYRINSTKPNLSIFETEALKQLSKNTNIVLKPADKGSAVVIMDRQDYVSEGLRQLSDTNYYTKLDHPIFTETVPVIEKIVNSLYNKKFINSKQRCYLLSNKIARPRRFYMLPKIHKAAEKWSIPFKVPPGRPIVSNCNSETYHTAKYIDSYLNPLSIKHDSYIKNTYFFVDKIKTLVIPQTAFLFSMDVASLYTNIDTLQGISAVKNIFLKYPDSKRPDKEILQLLEINLTRNDFEFEGQYYLQVKGTAMGCSFAPSYADIFMSQWETGALATCEKKPLHYYRYLDDIWGVWGYSEAEFFQFLDKMNKYNDSIQLTAVLSQNSIDFLDTTTYKGPHFKDTNRLDVKVFFKETDSHSLLYRTSFHPRHTFKGLVKSQLIRFKRICTRQEDFRQAVKILFSSLIHRGYTYTILRDALRTFERTKPICLDSILPIIVQYSEHNVHFVQKLKHNFSCSGGSTFLPEHKLIAAYRRNKNLQDILVKSKLKPLNPPKNRRLDDFFRSYRFVQNQTTKEVFKPQEGLDAQTKNCVYLIRCHQCSLQYVGESGNSLLTRFTQHRYNILKRKNLHSPLVRHFIHHSWSNLRATILEANPSWTVQLRRKTERMWIKRLNTIIPRGLNEK